MASLLGYRRFSASTFCCCPSTYFDFAKLSPLSPLFDRATSAVEPQWRRRGIGTQFLHAAMDWCGQSGPPLLRMVFCRSSLPIRRLVAKTTAKLDVAFDEMSAEITFDVQGVSHVCGR